MSKSCNDIPVAGYFARRKTHKNRDRFDAYYMLINPATKKPYTNADVMAALLQRKKEYPQLAKLVEPWLEELAPSAERKPNAIYTMCRCAPTKDAALKRLKKECWYLLEALGCILFRPLYERNLRVGDINVYDFVTYQRNSLYCDSSPSKRKRLLSILDNIILPKIGTVKLNALNEDRQTRALKSIGQEHASSSAQQKNLIRQSYTGLMSALKDSGWMGCSTSKNLLSLIPVSRHNSAIQSSYKPNHLDDAQRHALFELLLQPNHLYELFLVAMLYSGFAPSELSAITYADWDDITLTSGDHCYTCLITRFVRKLHNRYSTISATNENFSASRLRRIVLAPWAGDVLLRRIEQLRDIGYSDDQIRSMRLSAETPNDAIIGPAEIADRLRPLMRSVNLGITPVTRTADNGHPYRQKIYEDLPLLQRDAKYLATRIGADEIMLHAMTGGKWSTTDERHYLDLLSDQYAVARYLRLRRWSPFAPETLPPPDDNEHLIGYPSAPGRHIMRITNNTDHPSTLTLSASYAINASWTPS